MNKDDYILDDLFEKRNKEYGVYALRKAYNKYLMISFISAAAIICTAFFLPVIIDALSADDKEGKLTVKDVRSVEYAALASPPPIEASQPKQVTPALKPKMKSTVKFVKPVPKPDEEVIEEELVPTQEELKDIDAALQTVEGDDDGVLFFGDEMDVLQGEGEPAAEPLTIVQIMPSFPGGDTELFKFLGEELRYPPRARENGISGTVVTQFVIEIDGTISEIEILRSLTDDCDEEVIRVLKGMPLWSPGIQNQMKVRVRFTLPVNFILK